MALKKTRDARVDLRPTKDDNEPRANASRRGEEIIENKNMPNNEIDLGDAKEERRVDLEKIKQEWLAKKKIADKKEFVDEIEKIRMENKKDGEKMEFKRIEEKEEAAQKINQVKKEEASKINIPPGEYKFPSGFLWGTSTSAYQIEGGIKNDWSEWERSLSRLQSLMRAGKKSADYICGKACDSYNRYAEDFDLAAGLNNNAVRFGLEWARVQPKKDTWDTEAIKHYRRVLRAAKERGLITVVTLWHWTIPLWLAEEKGWENKQAIEYFKEYVAFVVDELGADIDYWVTLNEPMLLANYGYLLGKFPPGKHSYFKFRRAAKNLIKVHKEAYKIIHKHFPKAKVSITNLSNVFEPKRKWLLTDIILTFFAKSYGLNRFFKKINNYIDYIGIDYYRKIYIKSWPPFMDAKKDKVTDLGWAIYPKGIYELIKNFSRFKKPILILENGLADAKDKYRADFIREHLYWVHKAIEEGADVRGYFYWSLLDNFEWADGWKPKFGLYAVDRQTFERIARPSAEVYREICGKNKLIYNL